MKKVLVEISPGWLQWEKHHKRGSKRNLFQDPACSADDLQRATKNILWANNRPFSHTSIEHNSIGCFPWKKFWKWLLPFQIFISISYPSVWPILSDWKCGLGVYNDWSLKYWLYHSYGCWDIHFALFEQKWLGCSLFFGTKNKATLQNNKRQQSWERWHAQIFFFQANYSVNLHIRL